MRPRVTQTQRSITQHSTTSHSVAGEIIHSIAVEGLLWVAGLLLARAGCGRDGWGKLTIARLWRSPIRQRLAIHAVVVDAVVHHGCLRHGHELLLGGARGSRDGWRHVVLLLLLLWRTNKILVPAWIQGRSENGIQNTLQTIAHDHEGHVAIARLRKGMIVEELEEMLNAGKSLSGLESNLPCAPPETIKQANILDE